MGKLTADERREFLVAKLKEQRHLLNKSVQDIVGGDLAEALRVAVIVRVLIHETGSSKPLLKQLNKSFLDMPILDEPPRESAEAPPGTRSAVILSVPIGVNISAAGVFLNPKLDARTHTPTPLSDWWSRDSLILPGIGGISRREVILGLAHKEGGAHVDTDIGDKYKMLLGSKSFMVGWGDHPAEPLVLSRMMAGQAGVEVLDFLDRHFPL